MATKKREITRKFKTTTKKDGTQYEKQTGTVSPPAPRDITVEPSGPQPYIPTREGNINGGST